MTHGDQLAGGAATGSTAQLDNGGGHHGADALPLNLAPGGAAIEGLTKALAMFGGLLLLLAVVLTLFSVAGRYILGSPVPGDYELVEIGCGVAVFLFFPFTHAVGSNISAEFFTSGLPLAYRRFLDTLHEVIFFLLGILLTWRMSHALEEKFSSGETSILIGLPLWIAYAVGVFSLALLTLVCLLRIFAGIASLRGQKQKI